MHLLALNKIAQKRRNRTHIVFAALLLLTQVIPFPALAATNTWSFITSSDYVFDADAIEFASNQARILPTSDWYDTAWTNRKEIVVDNTLGDSSLTNYQMEFEVPYESGMQSDFDDVRFTDTTGTTTLDYWLETKTDSDTATYWVNVPSIAANATSTLYLYYGNTSASSASSYANTFEHGSDFSSGTDTLTTRASATSTIEVLAEATDLNDPRYRRIWTKSEEPSISGSDVGRMQVREMAILQDTNNRVVFENGKYVAYFNSRFGPSPNNYIDSFRAESTDLITWTNFTEVITHDPASFDALYASVGTSMKFGPSDYRLWYNGQVSAAAGSVVCFCPRTDGITWTKQGVAIATSTIPDTHNLSVPNIHRISDGRYIMLLERNIASADPKLWRVHGYESTDALNWTPLNGGAALFEAGPPGSWDGVHSANPKLMELPNGTFVIQYNGGPGTTGSNARFQIGYATATDINGPYTFEDSSPVIGRTYLPQNYGVETSAWLYNETGDAWLHYVQIFTGTSQTSKIYKSDPIRVPGLLIESKETTDSAFVGEVIDTTPFIARTESYLGAGRDDALAGQTLLGLYDSATVPTAGTVASHDANQRIEVRRFGESNAAPGDIQITYQDTNGTTQYWTGVDWSTATTTAISATLQRPVYAEIEDDGTNFVMRVGYHDTDVSIATTSIAKASVQAFSGNRTLWVGDLFTDSVAGQILLESFVIRSNADPEPGYTISASTSHPYPETGPSIQPTSAFSNELRSFIGFSQSGTNDQDVTYQLSSDNGNTWHFLSGSSWTQTSVGVTESSTASLIDQYIDQFSTGTEEFLFKAFLNSNGSDRVALTSVSLEYDSDTRGGSSGGGSSRSSSSSTQSTTSTVTAGGSTNLTPAFTRNLSLGATGSDVSLLQTFLKVRGYYTYPTITGYFGPITQSALLAIQRDRALDTTGIVDAQTRAYLNTLVPGVATAASPSLAGGSVFYRDLTLGSTGEDVRALQQYLNARGFSVSITGPGSTGSETSYFGPATRSALSRYQAARGILPSVGYFGPLTRTDISSRP